MRAPAEPRVRYGAGFWVYFAVLIALWIFAVISGFSIGLFILPIPLAMFVGVLLWRWKPAVAGLVSAVAVAAITYVLLAPLYRFTRSTAFFGRRRSRSVQEEGCHGFLLEELPLERCDQATARAILLAVAWGLVAAVAATLLTWAIQRAVRRPRAIAAGPL